MRVRTVLLGSELAVGLVAVPCGLLLVANRLGMPREVLADSPFESFLVPGLLLTFVVGSSLLTAAWLVWTHHSFAPLASLGAGAVLLGWIVVEAVLVDRGRGLQVIVLLFALLILGLAWRLRRRVGAVAMPSEIGRT